MHHYNEHKLTKCELKALRNADTICLDWHKGTGYIRAIKRKENTGDGFEQTVKVSVDTVVKAYGSQDRVDKVVSCYGMLHYPKTDLFWRTVVGLLKAKDILTLTWTEVGPDGGKSYIGGAVTTTDSGSAHAAPLYWDRVDLKVKRTLPSGRVKELAFRLRNGHTPDNSAKMIRRRMW